MAVLVSYHCASLQPGLLFRCIGRVPGHGFLLSLFVWKQELGKITL